MHPVHQRNYSFDGQDTRFPHINKGSIMIRMIFLSIMLTFSAHLLATLTYKDQLLRQLETTLTKIDSLEGHGAISHLYGLEKYLNFIEKTLANKNNKPEALSCVYSIAEKICSRYSYRDGSYRSRVYAHAQQSLCKLLNSSGAGTQLLKKLTQKYPVIAALNS